MPLPYPIFFGVHLSFFFFLVVFFSSSHTNAGYKETPSAKYCPLRIGSRFPGVLFAPFEAEAYNQFNFLELFLEGLVSTDLLGQLQSGVASSWQIFEGGARYRFFINRHAQFHNGSPIRAQDVQYSLCQHLNPQKKSLLKNYLGLVLADLRYDPRSHSCPAVQITGSHAVDIHLKGPYPLLLSVLSHPGFGIVPDGFDGTEKIGSGPYRFDFENEKGVIFLKKASSFWGPPPEHQAISWTTFHTSEELVEALSQEKINLAFGFSLLNTKLDKISGFHKSHLGGISSVHFYLNSSRPLFKEIEFRKDFVGLLNSFKQASSFFSNMDLLLNTCLPQGLMPFWYYKRPHQHMSPSTFKQKYGFHEKNLKFLVLNHVLNPAFHENFKKKMELSGFKIMDIKTRKTSYVETIVKGQFDLLLFTFVGLGADPDAYLPGLDFGYLLNHTPAHLKIFREKLQKARFLSPPEERLDQYAKIFMEYEKQYYIVPFLQRYPPVFYSSYLSLPNFDFNNYITLRAIKTK